MNSTWSWPPCVESEDRVQWQVLSRKMSVKRASDQRSTAIVMTDTTTLVRFIIRRIHVAFLGEYINTLDTLARDNTAAEAVSSRTRSGDRHHPPDPLQLNEEDEDLQLQEGVEINMNEFRVLSLHELQDDNLEVGSQDSSVRGFQRQL
ncbi:hypothetical protein INT45_000880 [Circinella minor]|uniref:Uncharacterized protein n=1 Tax=Circinella minor TaxID=1195481 RepID=A0A8H7RUJ5_9FUNG|nr:hypothetical protein INT45_000880 [Circinella minor]